MSRVSPKDFEELPLSVRKELDKRACTIPQAFQERDLHNVIQGRFIKPNSFDIAVLCSRYQISTILVFRGGEVDHVDELDSSPDHFYLQGWDDGEYVFSRKISAVSPKTIRKYHELYGESELPMLDHDGIDNYFVGKASHIWYWHNGAWVSLPGAD